MNGYLVLLIHTMDDLPVFLAATMAEAREFAKTVEAMPTAEILTVYGTDCSTPASVCIVEFHNGLPVESWSVKYFGDE